MCNSEDIQGVPLALAGLFGRKGIWGYGYGYGYGYGNGYGNGYGYGYGVRFG